MGPLLYMAHAGAIWTIGVDGLPDQLLSPDEAMALHARFDDRARFCRRKRDAEGAFIAASIAREILDAIEAIQIHSREDVA